MLHGVGKKWRIVHFKKSCPHYLSVSKWTIQGASYLYNIIFIFLVLHLFTFVHNTASSIWFLFNLNTPGVTFHLNMSVHSLCTSTLVLTSIPSASPMKTNTTFSLHYSVPGNNFLTKYSNKPLVIWCIRLGLYQITTSLVFYLYTILNSMQ